MSILVFDQTMIGKLKTVVGDSGRDSRRPGVLWGYFKPVVSPETVDQYECPVSEEELERRWRGRAAAGRHSARSKESPGCLDNQGGTGIAAIWLNAADRGLIAAAADSRSPVAQFPAAVGESRPDGWRIAYQLPLGIDS